MKNLQKGFVVPVLVAIIAILVIGGGVYIYESKKVETPVVITNTTLPQNQIPQQTNTQTPSPNIPTNNPPSQTDTSFKILSPKAGDSWKIGGTYAIKFQNLPKGSFVQGWFQNKNEANTGTASIAAVDTGRDGNPSSNIQITVPSQWCGGECGSVQYVASGQYRLLLRVYSSVNNPSYQTFYSDYFTLTNTISSRSISVPGMQQYTDSSFGFSFWYPNTWTVQTTAIKNNYAGGVVQKTLTLSTPSNQNGWTGQATIDEFYSAGSEITIARDLCSPMSGSFVAAHRYYFNFNAHTWMIEVPAYTGTSERDGSTYSVAASTKAADVSSNTMGGLHMLGAGCSGAIIPLSANNFVVFSFNSRNVGSNYINIAKTITATDPSVAMPVSSEEQRQVITKAGVLLGTIGTKVGQWYVTSDHVYNWLGDVVVGANPLTFRLIYSNEADGVLYATDGVHVYSAWSAEAPVLSGADPATFVAIKQQYQIPYAQNSGRYGQSFTSYEVTFAKDKSYVWYEGKLIPGADPTTFVVTGNTHIQNSYGGYTLAHDASHTYGIDAKGNVTIDGRNII